MLAALHATAFLIVMLLGSATVGAAEKRQALVVGNNEYAYLPKLTKAVNDARSMGHVLAGLGFKVEVLTDLDRRSFNEALTRFESRLDNDTTSFVFFAGHGVEIEGANYLLPVDVPLVGPTERSLLVDEAVPLGRILDRLNRAGASIVVLDACRDNPFPQVAGRSVGSPRGLAYAAPPRGTFIVYSAGARQQALDALGSGDNSPHGVFTRVFLEEFARPGQSIRSAVVNTRTRVSALAGSVGHEQFPAYYDQLTSDIVLAAAEPEPKAPDCNAARQSWDYVQHGDRSADLEAFIERFDGCFMADLARIRLAELRAPPPAPPEAKPPDEARPADDTAAAPAVASAPDAPPDPVPSQPDAAAVDPQADVDPAQERLPDPDTRTLDDRVAQEPAIVELDEFRVTVTVSNVRAAPAKDAARRATLREHTVVRATGRVADGTWVRVALSGSRTGWIWAELLEPVSRSELVDWRVASKGDAEVVRQFLRRHPNGALAGAARARLAELEASTARELSRGGATSYRAPGDDPNRARAFLNQHRRQIEAAIAAYYRDHGTIWDKPSVAQNAEKLYEIRYIRLDSAYAGSLDLLVGYRWEGDGIVADAEAKFRVSITPQAIEVVEMWR